MSSDVAIKIEGLSKCYQVYENPGDRLKQFLLPRAKKLLNLPSKQYFREFWALRNISFDVNKGEAVGIIGRNGSGKSTLLQLICGTLNPTSGQVLTNGRIAALLELGSGFNPEFTGRENVYLNGAVLGLSRHEINDRFDRIAAFADIGDFLDQPAKTYSSGMVVRLAFSVAINVDPEILIVDEALAVGDELFQRKCFARIETIRASGTTILFVSHSGAQIIELCNRAVLLDSGEQLTIGEPKHVVSCYQKLLYAPDAARTEIRDQVLQNSQTTNNEASTPDKHLNFEYDADGQEETFDPHLVPSSSIDFESHGPIIGQPTLLTMNRTKVNNLVRGNRYRYAYQVTFDGNATSVRFGMSIKTTTGLTLAGALSAPTLSEAIPVVCAGGCIDVEFTFLANLNPGIYFMNAGVFGIKDGDETVLHRRADVVAFRILPVPENIETETVSFNFEPSVSLHE